MWTRLIVLTTIAISLAGSAMYAHNRGKQSGMQQVQILWDSEKLERAQAHAKELTKARQREQALQTLAEKLRLEKRREADRLAREYAADLERLRDRPETRAGAGGVPEGAAAGVGCTGAGLARLDAELLTGYANAAARLQSALDQCRAQYAEVERAMNR